MNPPQKAYSVLKRNAEERDKLFRFGEAGLLGSKFCVNAKRRVSKFPGNYLANTFSENRRLVFWTVSFFLYAQPCVFTFAGSHKNIHPPYENSVAKAVL